jgi:ankyrin repeat protein
MTPRPLPDRPNLEQLKKLAKSLLHEAQRGMPDAIQRFAALPAFAKRAAGSIHPDELALHDAQSVIAREHGFLSWNALRDEVAVRTLSFDEAVDAFVRAATGAAADRARRLLALHPRIAGATLQTSLVLGDASAVETWLQGRKQMATTPGGPHDWEPLLYVCQTSLRGAPGSADGLVAIARELCALGANPNAEYHWNWHPELPRTALWGALCVVAHLPLAEVLLEAGANPTDGVSAHIAGGGGNVAALELLHRYGMNVDGIPDGVPPLVYMMTWATNPAGPRWLIEHGANPDLAWGDAAEAPLHFAARRWDVAMVDLLLQHHADPHRRNAEGRTPFALAELHGNREIAARLAAAGAADDLTPLDRFVAACARGDRRAAEELIAKQPALRGALRPEHHLLLHRFAESGNAQVIETMAACGFDPNVRDKDAVTPLHRAAMAGHADAARVLLAHGADVNAVDRMFAATPLVWAVEGRSHAKEGSDHVAVARVLIAAGSSLEWQAPEGAPHQEHTQDALLDLRRAASEHAEV